MKRKYIVSLVVIGLLLAVTFVMGTGYGLWVSTQDTNELSATTLDCFKVYYSDSDTIEMKNIKPLTNEAGLETSPYTLVITNICSEDKELQVRLNVIDETSSNLNLNALTVEATGNIEQETILYNNLNKTKTTEEKVTQSRLIGSVKVKPNETVRTNIKIWFDERKAPTIDRTYIFKAKFELIDTASTIKATFAETILGNTDKIVGKGNPNFSNVSTSADGLYATSDDVGTSYYYRGVVNNNYVQFGNYIWRIVRVNSDGSVRLILDKAATYTTFNTRANEKDMAGFYYIYYVTLTSSNVNKVLENWYNTNIISKDLDKYVATSTYCNDSGYVTTNYHTYFNGYKRLTEDMQPSLVCPETNADFGGTYKQKIGLITADEVVLAGGLYENNNMNYYLYNGETFFTMTGYDFYQYNAKMFSVNNTGALVSSKTNEELGIRPVISLNSNVTVSGSGTQDNPYTIDMQ